MNRKQLKKKARLAYMDTPRLYMTTFIYILILLLLNLISNRINPVASEMSALSGSFTQLLASGKPLPMLGRRDYAALLLMLAIEIVIQIAAVGYMSFVLNISRGRKTSVSNLADGFRVTFKIFALAFLQGMFVFLWSLLLVVPGIIAAYRYRMAWYILLDDPDKGALQCIRESSELMRGHKGELFLLDLSFIGWDLLIMLSASILAIWIYPYTETTYAVFYNTIAYPDGVFPASAEEEQEP